MDGEYRTSLTESGSIRILLGLYRAQTKLKLDDLLPYVTNFYALRKRLALFQEEDLIVESLEMDPRKVVYIRLTEKGNEVASVLRTAVGLVPCDKIHGCSIYMKYSAPVIVMLFRNGKLQFSEILAVFPNYVPIIKNLLPALERDGLVRTWKETTGYKPYIAELTPLGKMVGAGLDEVYRILTKEK